ITCLQDGEKATKLLQLTIPIPASETCRVCSVPLSPLMLWRTLGAGFPSEWEKDSCWSSRMAPGAPCSALWKIWARLHHWDRQLGPGLWTDSPGVFMTVSAFMCLIGLHFHDWDFIRVSFLS
ncbi:hypothetical protein Cadr_000014988, partial [Camelus dromedarius]